jgi:YhcH/YjgK/YiaL family protein
LYGDKADEIACVLRPGNFAVLFPADAHRPWCAVDGRTATVRKVVFKIDTRQ